MKKKQMDEDGKPVEVEVEEYVDVREYLMTCDHDQVKWLITQFNLYGSLCRGRNVIWKLFLQDVLTTQFLFNSVWDTSFQGLRTPFFNLLVSLYINQYPLEVVDYPEYLKVLSSSINRKEYRISYSIKQKMEDSDMVPDLFRPLIKSLNIELEKGARELREALNDHIECLRNKELTIFDFNKINKANSMEGLFNLVELLMKLDIHDLINEEESLTPLVQSCLTILQYSIHYPQQIMLLDKLAEKNKKERGTVQTILELIKGSKMKEDQIKTKKNLFDNQTTEDNPLIRNFFYTKSFLNREMHEFLQKEDKDDILLKLKILNIFNRIISKRQNFLIENMTCWAQKLGEEFLDEDYTHELENQILTNIKNEIDFVLPEIMKTSVKYIDKENNKTQFTHYIEEDIKEIYDFDHLLVNKPSSTPQTELQDYKEILPSMLISIMTCVNSELEAESIKLLLRMFNQRNEFANSLKEVYLLTNEDGVTTFQEIREISSRLEFISKRLEVRQILIFSAMVLKLSGC